MGTSRNILREAEAAFKRHGMDIDKYCEILTNYARGFREIVDHDRLQLKKCDFFKQAGQDARAKKFAPKLVTVIDAETGREREVIVVDEGSSLKALKQIGEIVGLTQSGINVNVNANAKVGTGPDGKIIDVGPGDEISDLVTMIDSDASEEVQEKVKQIPDEKRREMLGLILKDARKTTQEQQEAG